jgi:carboxymethylenebutenolidase
MQEDMDPALDPTLDQLSRRKFIGRVGAGAVTAAAIGTGAGAQEKKASAVDDPHIEHHNVTFTSGSQKVEGFLAKPKGGGKHGSVIVIHEIFGVTDHIKDVTARLAKAGYNALAVNFFTREGAPPKLDGDFAPLMAFVNKIPDSQVLNDIQAAATYLRSQPGSNGKVGTVGFCWGGYYSMLASTLGSPGKKNILNAVVAYYGRIKLPPNTDRAMKPHSPLEAVPTMHAPLLGHFGALDTGITPEDAAALREELKKDHKTGEVYVYEGAGHAFNNDTRESYNAAAAKLAWGRTLDWFGKYLKG